MSNAKIAPRPRARKSTTTLAPPAPAPHDPLACRSLPRTPTPAEHAALRAYLEADPTVTEAELGRLLLRLGDARNRPSAPLAPEQRDAARVELALALDALPSALRAVARLSQALEELGSPLPALVADEVLEAGREAVAEALDAIELATQVTEEAQALVDLGVPSHRRRLGQARARAAEAARRRTPSGAAAASAGGAS